MSTTFTIDERRLSRPTSRGTDPPRPAGSKGPRARQAISAVAAAADRQQEQLPTFAPLLEEVELDGWSSHQRMFSGNFHDWMLLEGGRVLVMVGQASGAEPCDPIETALVAQAAWTAIRAHAHHTDDAGRLLSLAAQTLWTNPTMNQQASVAVALVDAVGGSASLAIAGDCVGLPGACGNVGATAHATSRRSGRRPTSLTPPTSSHSRSASGCCWWPTIPPIAPQNSSPRSPSSFTRLDAESHRRMTAADALAIVRRGTNKKRPTTRRPRPASSPCGGGKDGSHAVDRSHFG